MQGLHQVAQITKTTTCPGDRWLYRSAVDILAAISGATLPIARSVIHAIRTGQRLRWSRHSFCCRESAEVQDIAIVLDALLEPAVRPHPGRFEIHPLRKYLT